MGNSSVGNSSTAFSVTLRDVKCLLPKMTDSGDVVDFLQSFEKVLIECKRASTTRYISELTERINSALEAAAAQVTKSQDRMEHNYNKSANQGH